MDFDLDDSSEGFRQEARSLIRSLLSPEVVEEAHRTGTYHDGDFHRALASKGYLAPGWPVELGGLGKDPEEVLVFQEELQRADAPWIGAGTTMMIAGVIRAIGTERQRAEILPLALRGEILIVLGFTEPECGSDVASAATRAVRDGDEWVINGQKMFTTNAHVADYVFLLARTDPDLPKHKGLTTFLVPLDQPGVSIQPVMTMSGERTNITFYDGARVHDDLRIGEVNGGWDAMGVALTLERTNPGGIRHERLVAAAERLASSTRREDGSLLIEDPDVQIRLARAATEGRVARLLGRRAVWLYAKGELPGVEGSMSKLFNSESLVRAAEDLSAICPEALRSDDPDSLAIERALRHAPAGAIYGGTSEVQRSIIAQRHLGLPRPT